MAQGNNNYPYLALQLPYLESIANLSGDGSVILPRLPLLSFPV
jgi:hypothetical protein